MRLTGASVLVTGASSGIGAVTAELLAARGARVGLVARRADRLEEVLERCRAHQPDSQMWVADLGDLDRAVEVALQADDHFGGLDVLVNNAAIPKRRDVRDLTVDDLETVMRVDFTSPVRMSMALLPRMVERDRGVVVNVSSLGGRLGIVHETSYCAAKFALCGWSEAMALDLWKTGIDIRLVIPGPIDTEIWLRPDNEASRYDGPLEPPLVVAEAIAEAIEGDRFEYYAPDLRSIAEFKTSQIDLFLEGAAAMGEPEDHS